MDRTEGKELDERQRQKAACCIHSWKLDRPGEKKSPGNRGPRGNEKRREFG